MSQKTRVLNFSDLNEEEKEQYIRFMIENNINFQEDDQDEQYVAKVKIRNNTRNQPPKPRYVRDENVLERGPRHTSTSNLASVSIPNHTSFDKQQRKASREKPAKSNNKNPFVLASQNTKKGAVNSNGADYMSFRNAREDTFPLEGTQEDQRNMSHLIDSIDLRNETSSVNKSKEFQRSSQYKSREDLNRSKSVNQVEKRLNFDEGNSFVTYEKNPVKKSSIADEYMVNCIEQYKSFAELANMVEAASQGRPKKLSSDHLSKQIEEIFSSRFIKETTALKSTMNKGMESNKGDTRLNRKLNSFPYFVYEFLKERNKFTKAFEQAALSLAYSTILTKRKSYEAEIFSKFLSEEFDTEDLTFFLFVRSIVEKELALVLANKTTSSTIGILLTQKNCYKILESVYGFEEKTLVNRVFKKVKDHIEWEKEKKIDLRTGKIHLYSFLKITLEDYHITRKNIQSTLDEADDRKSVNTINEGKLINQNEGSTQLKASDIETGTSKHEIKEEEEESRADVDDIDHYLFGKPRASASTGGDSNKALHDITNQGAQNVALPTGMFSNIHNYYYNNPNSRHRNSLTDQSQEFSAFETQTVPEIMTVPTHSSNQSMTQSQSNKAFKYTPIAARETTGLANQNSKVLSRSSSNLVPSASTKESYSVNTHKTTASGLPRAMTSSHQNLQSVPSLNSSNSTTGNRNSYSNIHRRNSGSMKNIASSQAQGSSANIKVPSTSDLSSGFSSNANLNSQANLQSQQNLQVDNSVKEIINTTGNFDSFSPMERTNTRDIDASLAKNTLPTIINYTSIDKSMMDNFSFRNWDSQKQDLLNESAVPEKINETASVQLKPESVPESSRSYDKSFNQGDDKSSKLQDYCLVFMMHKVHEFIETMLFEGQEQRSPEEEKVKAGLLDLFERKFRSLIKALFSFDKLKWLNSLMIEDPTSKQLQNIEELQKDLRSLQKRPFDDLNEEDIEIFANKIFRTPELSTQIGRLIVEFTLPQDLLYGEDVAE